MKTISSDVLSIKEFDEAIFKEKIDYITVVSNTELLFQLKDGSKIIKQWQFKRRQPAWSEERKKREAEKMKEAWRKKHEQNKDN
ncbi:hypothetical protein [Gudongella sp. DL1XJH-153]|uniref:hypothetical protein n=1 Tax=Gudongella sp. DL1XJH-153 TaxID=3409804 RepID=UPI003BB6C6C9